MNGSRLMTLWDSRNGVRPVQRKCRPLLIRQAEKDGNAVVVFANDTFVILSESYEELKALIQA